VDLTALQAMLARDLNEPTTNNARWTAAMATAALNEVYVELATVAERFTREFTLTSVSGQRTYTLPGDVVRVQRVTYDGGLPMAFAQVRTLEIIDPSWEVAVSGTPRRYYTPDARGLMGIYPPANTNAKNLAVRAAIIPFAHTPTTPTGGILPLVTGTDVPAFPSQFHPLLVHGAVLTIATRYRLNDESEARVGAAKGDYDSLMVEFLAWAGK